MMTEVFADIDSYIKQNIINNIYEERNRYSVILNLIHQFCVGNSVIVSNLNVITNEQDELTLIKDQSFVIYSNHVYKTALNLTNYLAQNLNVDDAKYVKMTTDIEYEEFSIFYKEMNIVKAFLMKNFKNIDVLDLISPIDINKVKYIPGNIEIIDVLHKLYTVTDFTKYSKYYTNIMQLISTSFSLSNNSFIFDNVNLRKITTMIKNKLSNTEYIVISTHAVDDTSTDKLQIIGDNLDNLHALLTHTFLNHTVSYQEQNIHIPKDHRIKKYTFYLTKDNKKYAVLDYYNNLEYELIPASKVNNLLIAHPYVTLRFLFIELWILTIIRKLDSLSENHFGKLSHNVILAIITLHKNLNKSANLPYEFFGKYIDAVIAKKMDVILSDNKLHVPYYPSQYFMINNKYKGE